MRIGKRISAGARIVLMVAAAAVPLGGAPRCGAADVVAAAPTEEQLGKAALAEEFAGAALAAVGHAQVARAELRQSIALLRAACMEFDREPRFPRLLAEACHQIGDDEGQINALVRYRAINVPQVANDQFAQVELIDLYAGQKQTAEEKLGYLKTILAVQTLPDPVRSHVAMSCSDLMKLKFDTNGAALMLDEALRLNPLNPVALQGKYEAAQVNGTSAQRVAALVSLLKCNPAQPSVMSALADELAAAGQPDLAVTWYNRSFDLTQQLGAQRDSGKYLDCAAALYAMDQPKRGDEMAVRLLNSNVANVGAAMLRLLIARQAATAPAGGGPPADAVVVQHARDAAADALKAQLGILHAQLNDAAAATQPAATQPLDPLADITADAVKLQAIKNTPEMTREQAAFFDGYAAALANQIWFYAYYDPQPAKATKLLDILRSLKPDGDADVTKLEGFTYLADGKREEAKVKLSAVADRDALAKLGMLLIEPDPAAAARLVTEHSAGLLGATLLDGLRDKGGKFVPSAASAAVLSEANKFPDKLLELAMPGKAQSFYNLLAEPVHASRAFGEPALVKITIQNEGDFDLAIGPGCAIRSDLWFDVATQGGPDQSFSGVTYDHIAGPMVLLAHRAELPGTEQVVRVDVGPLAPLLRSRPLIAVTMFFSVFTNPISQPAGVAPGPCGYRRQFSSPMERKSAPVGNAARVNDLLEPLSTGKIDAKLQTLDLLIGYVDFFRAEIKKDQELLAPPAPPPTDGSAAAGDLPRPTSPLMGQVNPQQVQDTIKSMQQLIDLFTASVRHAMRDPAPLVRYWAQSKQAELAEPAGRAAMAAMMVQGKDWEQRELGLMLASGLPAAKAREIASAVKGDSVAWVNELAEATINIANQPAATQPTRAAASNSP